MITEWITRDQLEKVYKDPYIQKIGYDDRPPGIIENPYVQYLGAYKNDTFMGAFMAIRYSLYEYELHSLLLKRALKYSRELGMEFIEWAFTDKNVMRVTAYIIEGLEKAVNYCIKLGFKKEGIRRDACRVNDKPRSVYILGLTRSDWIGSA